MTAWLFATVALADPGVLRIATAAPDGTMWSRELRSFADQLARDTDGHVRLKVYFGAAFGDEPAVIEDVRRGRLDGIVSGGPACELAMPSLLVNSVPGLIKERDEASAIADRLGPDLTAEAGRAGWVYLGTVGLGPIMVFTRAPINNLVSLRRMPLWVWDSSNGPLKMARALGLTLVPMTPGDAAKAYDAGRVDGFLAYPQAALAFQWSAQARYVSSLRFGFSSGCLLVSQRAFDRLPLDAQRQLRSAAAHALARVDEIGRSQDDQLLGSLFARQGLVTIDASESFRAAFYEAVHLARDRLGDTLAPATLRNRVMQQLVDFRGEHGR